MNPKLTLHSLTQIPLVKVGDDLSGLLLDAIDAEGLQIEDGDILVIAQKIVSKSEDRQVNLDEITPSVRAVELSQQVDKDPRLVELILMESTEVIRTAPGVIIVRHRLGIVSANAGIDQSNIDHEDGECALLLPLDPDRSAQQLRTTLMKQTGTSIGIVISDSMNRPWRLGTLGYAIGCAGVKVLDDRRGDSDIFGRELKVTLSNRADSIASAATLLMGETTEKVPAVLVRGLPIEDGAQLARDSIRPVDQDLFL